MEGVDKPLGYLYLGVSAAWGRCVGKGSVGVS